MRRSLPIIVLIVPAFLALASESRAQWAPNGFPAVNANGNQTDIQSIPDGVGGVILTWQDARTSGTGPGAYAQRLNAAGVPQWTPNGVLLAVNGQRPRIVTDGAGGAVIAYQGSGGVMAQRLNFAGAPQWTGGGVVLSNLPNRPRLAPDGAGGAVVTWVVGAMPTRDIYAQKVNGSGANQWGANGIPVCRHPADQRDSEVIYDGAGGAIVAWVDLRSSTQRIFARRVTLAGDTTWTANGTMISPNSPATFAPALVPDGAGGVLFAIGDQRTAGGTQLYVQRHDANGNVQAGWTPFGYHIGGTFDPDPKVVAVSDGAGGIIVTRVGGRVDKVGATGGPQWTIDLIPFPTAFTAPVRVAIAADGYGGAYVAWDDFRNSTDSDVYAAHVRSDGTKNPSCDPDGDPLCQFTGTQQSPTICAANGVGAIVAWSDSRVAGADVYADLSTCMATVGVEPGPDGVLPALTAWPNPFGREVTVALTLPSPAPAELVLYDVRGRVVVRQPLDPGADGRGVARLSVPRALAAGSYFLHVVQNGAASAGRKVTLVR